MTLAACTPLTRWTQGQQTGYLDLTPSSLIGQTFSPSYHGLSGVEIFISPTDTGDGEILLGLSSSPRQSTPLYTSTVALNEVITPDYYRFSFPALANSQQQDYYLAISTKGSTEVQIGIGPGESYLNGALYLNGAPQDAQLRFRLVYDPWRAALGLAAEGLTWLAMLCAALWLFLLPGWALLRWLFPGWRKLHWSSQIGLALGTSLSLYPLFLAWCQAFNFEPGSMTAYLMPGFALITILFAQRGSLNLHYFSQRMLPALRKEISNYSNSAFLPDLTLFLVCGLVFFTRFWSVRNLDVPMWGNSVQHTMIAQLIVDHGGLFTDWAPYAELKSFTYHFGFHAAAAAFHWLTHLPVNEATLYTGQLVNFFAILALLPSCPSFRTR